MTRPEGTAGSSRGVAPCIGVDAGASLAKIAERDADGALLFHLEPGQALDRVADRVARTRPGRVGLTGCGAAELASRLGAAGCPAATTPVNEFAAWGRGARELLRAGGATEEDRHLLISLGTGTSVMQADGLAVNRIGGTALGGGTVVGLGAALLGTEDFGEIAALAERGSRKRVDLLVSDIYRPGEIALAGEITAANFGKLARRPEHLPEREDVAHALMGLVGENVALICAGLAAAHQVRAMVFGGATLRKNPSLVTILQGITTALGAKVTFLPDGEFAGALGALLLAEGQA